MEELKTSPNESEALSAPELVARALDRELNAGAPPPLPVNDLTMAVKKKKKPLAEDGAGAEKRKADGGEAGTPPEKKARLDDA